MNILVFFVRIFANSKIKRYGKILELQIKKNQKSIKGKFEAVGEISPIEITAKYKVQEESNSLTISITEFTTTREWLTRLLNDNLNDLKWEGLPILLKYFL
jgi:hypothetical protein